MSAMAGIPGGVTGLERQLRHKPAGLRTNLFICSGTAMVTVLLRHQAGIESDSARIAAKIIPGIGFIGAGSILHPRTTVARLTTAATLFAVASVGMAPGGGLYLTACFTTGLILISLEALGRLEGAFALKPILTTYEVRGQNVDSVLREVNPILENEGLTMERVSMAGEDSNVRMVFTVDIENERQTAFSLRLDQSNAVAAVRSLGVTEHE
jgi:putative Mg2+ transporter-C (MgtC) family protein